MKFSPRARVKAIRKNFLITGFKRLVKIDLNPGTPGCFLEKRLYPPLLLILDSELKTD
jgi:hypothetical protein